MAFQFYFSSNESLAHDSTTIGQHYRPISRMVASVGVCRRYAKLVLLALLVIANKDSESRLSAATNQDVTSSTTLSIKLAIFVDFSLEQHLTNNLRLGIGQWDAFFGAYVRQIEANFARLSSHSIRGIKFKLVEVIRRARNSTLISTGDIDLLLDNFCQHQNEWRLVHKAKGWDLSLLLTANDLYSEEDEAEPRATLGISLLSGINWPDLACSVVEFGVNYRSNLSDVNNQQASGIATRIDLGNPTRGFASTWVAAHEIGHSLGLHHDGPPFNRECSATSFMMSSSSFLTSMPRNWSNCSIAALERLDGTLLKKRLGSYRGEISETHDQELLPGELFNLQKQCEAFAEDLQISEERVDESICDKTVWCRRHGQLFAIGPALEGSQCDGANSKWCLKGECLLK